MNHPGLTLLIPRPCASVGFSFNSRAIDLIGGNTLGEIVEPNRAASVLAHYMDLAAGAHPRSWDAWHDAFSPAYDTIRTHMDEAVALTVAYVEYLGGLELSAADRARIGAGVRRYGKAFSFGLSEAIGHTDEFHPLQWCRYAEAVARNKVAQARRDRAENWQRSAAVQISPRDQS